MSGKTTLWLWYHCTVGWNCRFNHKSSFVLYFWWFGHQTFWWNGQLFIRIELAKPSHWLAEMLHFNDSKCTTTNLLSWIRNDHCELRNTFQSEYDDFEWLIFKYFNWDFIFRWQTKFIHTIQYWELSLLNKFTCQNTKIVNNEINNDDDVLHYSYWFCFFSSNFDAFSIIQRIIPNYNLLGSFSNVTTLWVGQNQSIDRKWIFYSLKRNSLFWYTKLIWLSVPCPFAMKYSFSTRFKFLKFSRIKINVAWRNKMGPLPIYRNALSWFHVGVSEVSLSTHQIIARKLFKFTVVVNISIGIIGFIAFHMNHHAWNNIEDYVYEFFQISVMLIMFNAAITMCSIGSRLTSIFSMLSCIYEKCKFIYHKSYEEGK